MGIDGIGKGGGLPPTPEAAGAGSAQKTGAVETPFKVDRPDQAAQASSVDSAQAAAPLERLRAGEIDVNGYMDLKVDEATRSIQGLPPAELDEIKKALREQLASDPGLTDLVRTATGQMPKPPED
jgi:hypothetical protein